MYDIIFVAAHPGDVIYSCANLLNIETGNRRCLIITVFTGIPRYLYGETGQKFGRLLEEDKQAMDHLNLEYRHLGFEPYQIRYQKRSMRGLHRVVPSIRNMCKSDDHIVLKIREELQYYVDIFKPREIYFPFGLSLDPDRVSVYRACRFLCRARRMAYTDYKYSSKVYKSIYAFFTPNAFKHGRFVRKNKMSQRKQYLHLYPSLVKRYKILKKRDDATVEEHYYRVENL